MEKSQLDNLINIAFLFNREMDSQWTDLNNDYILEKWNKIIGTEPDKSFSVYEDYVIDNWKRKWLVKDDEYQRVKHIINFIRIVNTDVDWRPDNLVKIYEDNIGDPNLISKEYYDHIHASVKNAIQIYKSRYLREYNLTLLV